MKRIIVSGTLTAFFFFGFISCSDNDSDPVTKPETESEPIYDLSKVEISDVGYISASDIYSKIVKSASEGNGEQDQILLDFAQQQFEMVAEKEQATTTSKEVCSINV